MGSEELRVSFKMYYYVNNAMYVFASVATMH